MPFRNASMRGDSYPPRANEVSNEAFDENPSDEVPETSEEDEDGEDDEDEEDDEDDEDDGSESTPESETKTKLCELLDGVETAGSFAAEYHTPTFVNPGLNIEGRGLIPLPLLPREAQAIINVSQQAPFGKGNETLVDTSVRNTWELNSNQFQCENPTWTAYITALVNKAGQELGVKGSIDAQLYKLLLYETGAFFKPHKDTEKVLGMFGTLVVCLPSKHTGGEVHVSHAGSTKIFKTAPRSTFDFSTLAWYSDVTHEIKPVESGYRLVLTYNLIQSASGISKSSAGLMLKQDILTQRVLAGWHDHFSSNQQIYILDHQYSQESLKLQSLKGRDKAVVQQLKTVSSVKGFYIFLATLDHWHIEDYGDDDDLGDDTTLKNIRTLTGVPVTDKVSVEIEDILQDEPFQRTPDSEEEGEFTGNESMPPSLRYHNSVVMIVPQSRLYQAIRGDYNPIPDEFLISLCRQSLQQPGNTRLRCDVEAFLKLSSKWKLQKLALVIDWSIRLGFPEICRSGLAVSLIYNSFPLSVAESIASTINQKASEIGGYSPQWKQWLLDITPPMTVPNLFKIFVAITPLLSGGALRVDFKTWISSLLCEKVPSFAHSLSTQQMPIVLNLLHFNGRDWFFDNFVPEFLRESKQENTTEFLLLLASQGKKLLNNQDILDIFRVVLKAKASTLALTGHNFHYGATSCNKFLRLVSNMLELKLVEEMDAVITASWLNFSDPNSQSGHNVMRQLPFIHELTESMPAWIGLSTLQAIRDLIISLLDNAARYFEGKRPMPGNGWALPLVKCSTMSCSPCLELDRFLADPIERVCHIRRNGEMRKHLKYNLDGRFLDSHIEQSGSPFTLVVTKKRTEYDVLLKSWTSEVEGFHQSLQTIRSTFLQNLFDSEYDHYFSVGRLLKGNVPAQEPANTHHLMPASGGNLNRGPAAPVVGTKRKFVEVVDLT
ncbi:hypothetical protein BT63DRAFT_454687 [Microthyrium microscopicum]|uniref:Uncharacterized protein n=1 Tax=Microthyrium microscopicum TaxID=703497 RepID=A0A6A6UHC8_9PEZI|nr:hypothetical protein BT63DRAFT_454687 [Microthyrium microscopicum]